MGDVRLDIPFRKDNSEVQGKEVFFSNVEAITSGTPEEEDFQSIERPLKATEVFSKLRRKGWGKFDGRFMTESDLISSQRLMYRVYIPEKSEKLGRDFPEDVIDVIDTGYRNVSSGEEVSDEVRISPFFQMWPEKFSSNINHNNDERRKIKNEVGEIYRSVFGEDMSDINTISFKKATRDILDLLENPISLEFISSDSDLYTNSLDLSELKNYVVIPGISAKVDVTIQYSVCSGDTVKVFNRDTTFCAFKYEFNEENNVVECSSDSFRETINNDVIVSYTSKTGVLEVIPISDRTSECIISRCTVTYGKF